MLLPAPIGPATLEPQNDFVPLRQLVFRIGEAEFLGDMGGFVDHIPAVGRGQCLQHFQVEQRDATGRRERSGRIVR